MMSPLPFNTRSIFLRNKTAVKFKTNMSTFKKIQPIVSIKSVSGFTSSLVFTPLQAIELSNPLAVKTKRIDGSKSYFSEFRNFRIPKNI